MCMRKVNVTAAAMLLTTVLAFGILFGISASPGAAKPSVAVASVFTDYQCTSCSRILPRIAQLEQNYGGKIEFTYKDFPLPQHKNARKAAYAAQSAALQGHGPAMHRKLFQGQREWSRADDPSPIFVNYARSLGLDVGEFRRALGSAEIKRKVDADIHEGQKLGVSRTPTVVFNGKLYVGKDIDQLERVIND
jgi:protein-disulfide isomerase